MKRSFCLYEYLLWMLILLTVMLLCICMGSVPVSLADTLRVLWQAVTGGDTASAMHRAIILSVRVPRVLCVGLMGAALALGGAAMQGLLRNPLADGSTLGISSGASLGAAVAILTGFSIPGLPLAGTAVMAMLFGLLSLAVLLSLAWVLDHSLSTHTVILIGVIFSMLVSSLLSLLLVFSGDKLRTITFWTMGSAASASYPAAVLLAVVLLAAGSVLISRARQLNAMSVGEEHALHLGVNVRAARLTVMVAVSCLVGVCVSVGGCIGFVGLVTPHILRMLVGPDHRRLLPASLFGGAVFLLLADLLARTVCAPNELPIGAVTSIIGACVFVSVFIRQRKAGDGA